MAVVRWLCSSPHAHLKDTQFIVHTLNSNAACMMVLQLHAMGFNVRSQPFCTALPTPAATDSSPTMSKMSKWMVRWLNRFQKLRLPCFI
jgi:hypothetical protein